MGNRTKIISTENKIKYHAAAALSSNYMTALFYMAQELFVQCGFDEKEAKDELYGLAKGNLENILINEKLVNIVLNCGKNHVSIKNPIVITPAII